MEIALILLLLVGIAGAFDTLYYHEWKARLPVLGRRAIPELPIHAGRDFLYGVLFGTLPWVEWRGAWTVVLGLVFLAEIVLTLWDFVIEPRVRRGMGDVLPGERVTHNAIGIIYGAMVAVLMPTLIDWWQSPTALVIEPAPVPLIVRLLLTALAAGVVASGLRDLYSLTGLAKSSWPWRAVEQGA